MKLTAAILTFLLTLNFTFADGGLHVGTAAVDISPTVFPIQLRSGPSNYVHDPMHVRAIAFQNGEGRAAVALIDAIGTGREMTDEAKAIVAERTGWSVEEMLVSGTHAHTTPKGGDTSPGRIAYEKTRFDGLVEALTKAIESLEPAQVGFAAEDEPSEVRNRRWYLKEGMMDKNPFGTYDKVRMNPNPATIDTPAGPIDPEVCIVDIRNRRGKPLGLIANYSLHYVGNIPTVIEEDGKVVGMASADYFGEFSRIFPYRTDGSNPENHFVAMMTNGTSGDINNIDFRRVRGPRAPFEQVRQVATKTADAAWRASKKIESFDTDPIVAMKQRSVTLKYRSMRQDEVEHALRILEMTRKEREGLDLHKKFVQYASATVRYSEPDKTEDVLIQAIRIGDQAIVSLPFEVLVEIGLEIKEKSPFPHTFTISLANGGYGYLPPPNQFDLGGYETWIGTCRFERESSVLLTKNLLEMLEELKALD
ncbi:MAG: hypothetical protein HRU46_09880 [Verrucomicrobiales bacterium]|nr:hypothetical protein [Verrucomicrobiales bacterium]